MPQRRTTTGGGTVGGARELLEVDGGDRAGGGAGAERDGHGRGAWYAVRDTRVDLRYAGVDQAGERGGAWRRIDASDIHAPRRGGGGVRRTGGQAAVCLLYTSPSPRD